jgi:4-amino-4-deoxy-L-arabinose transferase-like glycosyltransferase
MPLSNTEKILFMLILVSYIVVGTLFAMQTPAWQAPDEPAHYNYVAQVARDGCCPLIEDGDWQSDYQLELTTVKFAPDYLDRLDTIQYEDHQPPLYYLLASVVYSLTGGSLTALRLFSMVLGGVVVVIAFIIGKQVFPNRPQIALGTMALVAFQPQHMMMITSVNNDALAEVIIAVGLLWIIRYLQTEKIPVWQLGLIMALGLMIKTTIYFLAGVIPLAILLKWHTQKRPLRDLIQSWAIFLVIALGIGGLWWLRNFGVYGFPDFLGLRAHDSVVVGQLRTADYIAQNGIAVYRSEMLRVTFNSFWGQFGWMAVPLDNVLGGWVYRGFAGLMLVGISGLFVARLPRQPQGKIDDSNRRTRFNVWIILIATLILAVLAYLYYNSEFLQWQGRYMFPGLIPFALMMVYGLDSWRNLLLSRWENSGWLTVLLLLVFIPLDVYLLFKVIVVHLSP